VSVPDSIPEVDLYAELEVDRRASPEGIEAAYRQMIKRHHPDVAADEAAATTRVKRLNLARHWLSDPQRRAAYDRTFGWDRVEIHSDWQPPSTTIEDLLRVHEVRRRRQPPYAGIARLGLAMVGGGIAMGFAGGTLWTIGSLLVFCGAVPLLYGGVGIVVGIVMRRVTLG
jgi:hypothetical protein